MLSIIAFLATVAAAQDHAPSTSGGRYRPPQTSQFERRIQLSLGTLHIPARLPLHARVPLIVFFHGAWMPENAARELKTPVLSVYIPAMSDTYSATFADPGTFRKLLDEAAAKSGLTFGGITMGAFSAGCGAIRIMLRDPELYERIEAVVAMDGIHTDYKQGHAVDDSLMEVWLKLAKDAVVGRKGFIVTHTEVYPGAYASTTETANWLLRQLNLKRKPTVRLERGLTQLSEVNFGKFLLKGFAGREAPNHIDQLNALTSLVRWLNDSL